MTTTSDTSERPTEQTGWFVALDQKRAHQLGGDEGFPYVTRCGMLFYPWWRGEKRPDVRRCRKCEEAHG